jgi:hypothetical protein
VVLYLLSPGLVVFWEIRLGWTTPKWLEKPLVKVVFAPIWAAVRFEPVREAYSAYYSWCAGQPIHLRKPDPP